MGISYPHTPAGFLRARAGIVRRKQQVRCARWEHPASSLSFSDEWPAPNQDLGNRRVATSKIDSGNVDQLGVAWTDPDQGGGTFGNYASTPIVADGVVYTQDLTSNVKAIDLATGQVKWSKDYNAPDVGPNGVAIGYGKIYGATSDFAFALDKDTGKEVWRSAKLTRNANEGIDMAPGVFDGTVYISTVPGNAKSFYKGNGAGVLWALDADTGKAKWKFWTVPENLWSTAHTDINSGGGLWHPPAFDNNGDVYIDVANPAPWPGTNKFPWGSSRPGPEPAHEHAPQAEPRGRQDHLGAAGAPARRLRLGPAATADPGEGRQPRHRARRG